MSSLFETTYNPDVLSCLANLSNDEVFTPPELANQMLDLLPDELWSDPDATFLDPACKSGVFLREIAKRLIEGLKDEIPDLQERLDHIYRKQVFGIAITELTSLLSRRSLYCSKYPNSKYSVVRFDDVEGNIDYKRMMHTWKDGRCVYCGATQKEYDRDPSLEQYAYEFIHLDDPEEVFHMKFDVIVGNPPYQLSDGGGEGASAVPLYHRFVEQAMKLNPRYISMIIPARWYSGGKGLDGFRNEMLHDERLAEIHDFPETDLCFPGVNIRGGVCYFLWSRDHSGDAKIFNYSSSSPMSVSTRPLLEPGIETFIRYNKAISILRKVRALHEDVYSNRVYPRNPFGISSNFSTYSTSNATGNLLTLYRSRRGSTADKVVYVDKKYVLKNHSLVGKIKVIVSKASPGGDEYPHAIISTPLIAPKGSVSTETYLVIDTPATTQEAEHLIEYMETRFFRFLVSLIKNTQNISKGCFAFVPVQDLSRRWTDEALYAKYGISAEEIEFINSMIKPMSDGEQDVR